MQKLFKKIFKGFRVVFSRKTKWENIFALLMVAFDLYAIYTHIQLNGFYNELVIEFFIYFGLTFGLRYVIKDMRKNPKEWTCYLFDNED